MWFSSDSVAVQLWLGSIVVKLRFSCISVAVQFPIQVAGQLQFSGGSIPCLVAVPVQLPLGCSLAAVRMLFGCGLVAILLQLSCRSIAVLLQFSFSSVAVQPQFICISVEVHLRLSCNSRLVRLWFS